MTSSMIFLSALRFPELSDCNYRTSRRRVLFLCSTSLCISSDPYQHDDIYRMLESSDVHTDNDTKIGVESKTSPTGTIHSFSLDW